MNKVVAYLKLPRPTEMDVMHSANEDAVVQADTVRVPKTVEGLVDILPQEQRQDVEEVQLRQELPAEELVEEEEYYGEAEGEEYYGEAEGEEYYEEAEGEEYYEAEEYQPEEEEEYYQEYYEEEELPEEVYPEEQQYEEPAPEAVPPSGQEDKPAVQDEVKQAAAETANAAAEASKNLMKGFSSLGGGLMDSISSASKPKEQQKKQQQQKGFGFGGFGFGKAETKKNEGFGFGGFGFSGGSGKQAAAKEVKAKKSSFGFGSMLSNLESALDIPAPEPTTAPAQPRAASPPKQEAPQAPVERDTIEDEKPVVEAVEETHPMSTGQDNQEQQLETYPGEYTQNEEEGYYDGEEEWYEEEEEYYEAEEGVFDGAEEELVQEPQEEEVEQSKDEEMDAQVHPIQEEPDQIPESTPTEETVMNNMEVPNTTMESVSEETKTAAEDTTGVNKTDYNENVQENETYQAVTEQGDELYFKPHTAYFTPQERWWWAYGMIVKVNSSRERSTLICILFRLLFT